MANCSNWTTYLNLTEDAAREVEAQHVALGHRARVQEIDTTYSGYLEPADVRLFRVDVHKCVVGVCDGVQP